MIVSNIIDILVQIGYKWENSLSEFTQIGDVCAIREKNGLKIRANYERGILMVALADAFGCRNFLEIGTGRGYVTGCIAKFCKNVEKIVTIDVDKKSDICVSYFNKLNIPIDKIKFIQADANNMKSSDLDDEFDILFIDAEHNKESVKKNFNLAKSKSSTKAIFVFDDYHPKFQSVMDAINEIEFDQKY